MITLPGCTILELLLHRWLLTMAVQLKVFLFIRQAAFCWLQVNFQHVSAIQITLLVTEHFRWFRISILAETVFLSCSVYLFIYLNKRWNWNLTQSMILLYFYDFPLVYNWSRVPTLVLKVWKKKVWFSRLEKYGKKFFGHVSMENENIFQVLITHCFYYLNVVISCSVWPGHN